MERLISFYVKRESEGPCDHCREPIFQGDTAYEGAESGIIACSRRCAEQRHLANQQRYATAQSEF